MQHRILGTVLQVVEIALEPDEQITSVAGELSWMTDSIEVKRSTRMNNSGSPMTYGRGAATPMIYADYTAVGHPGVVAFSADLPGQIIELPIAKGESYLVHRTGFLCGTSGIDIATQYQQNLAIGGFSQHGLFLRTLSGEGTAFIELNGELVCYDLPPGKVYKVHPAHIGLLNSTVSMELLQIPGIRVDNILLIKLTGPGKIWLHSMPLVNIADSLKPFFEQSR